MRVNPRDAFAHLTSLLHSNVLLPKIEAFRMPHFHALSNLQCPTSESLFEVPTVLSAIGLPDLLFPGACVKPRLAALLSKRSLGVLA